MTEKPVDVSPRTPTRSPMPVAARVHLAHALVQHLARNVSADVLHLKGPAVLPGLRDPARTSADVDVLVRPSHLRRLIDVLERHGWDKRTDFATGSPFAHAANWWHDDWGWLDVHVEWPGARIDREEAYDVFAATATVLPIAHVDCAVPDRTSQRLILLLHSARSPGDDDRIRTWDEAEDAEREAVRALARRLDADVALAAAIGELDAYRADPDHALWEYFSTGRVDRIAEWRARLKAAHGLRAKATVIASVTRVNRDHLRLDLGREPTRQDLRRKQLQRVRTVFRELRSPTEDAR